METLEGLRRQIETATDLGSVVTTMKTLAAVSIRQYEAAADAVVRYQQTIEWGFQIVLRDHRQPREALPSRGQIGIVAFGTDQGMCGQFNDVVAQNVTDLCQDQRDAEPHYIAAVGQRMHDALLENKQQASVKFAVPSTVSEITGLVQELLLCVEDWQQQHNLTKLWIVSNQRKTASTYEPQAWQLLPIEPERFRTWSRQPWQSNSLPTYTLSRQRLLSLLVRQYLFAALFRASAESLASENASRIAAMQNAEKNIEERLDELRTTFNQMRQTAITEELMDIIVGFESIEARGARHEVRN